VPPGHHRSFRIGNAAAAVEPVGGEGIGLAIWSGTRIGELLVDALRSSGKLTAAQLFNIERRLRADYRRRLRWRQPFCRLASVAMDCPGLLRTLWPVLSVPAISIQPWYGLTGKPLINRSSTDRHAQAAGT
jgi:flavin-dependent dehydrogenase